MRLNGDRQIQPALLIKLVLGEDAYSAMQREGYTIYFEKREGLYGRCVAKTWLSWPKREHVYLLPGSAVRLEHADDHPQAIVKTYMESVREHLIVGTYSKQVHDPPAVAFAACLDAGARGSAD